MKRFQPRNSLLTALTACAFGGLAMIYAPVTRGQTQTEMNRSAGKDYQKADAEMNAAYKKLMAALDDEKKGSLKKAQTAWLKFRDAEGAFLSSKAKGGSVYPTVYATHVREITQARTQTLKKAYKLFTTEGDM